MYLLALQLSRESELWGANERGKDERKEEHFESSASRAAAIFKATSKEQGDNQHKLALIEPETGLYTLGNSTERKRHIP